MREHGKSRRQSSSRRDGLLKSEHGIGRQRSTRTISSNRRSHDDRSIETKKSDRAVGPKQPSLLSPFLSSFRRPSYRHSNSARELADSGCVLQRSNRSLPNSSSTGELGECDQAGRRGGSSARRELSMSEHGKGRRQGSTRPATPTSRRAPDFRDSFDRALEVVATVVPQSPSQSV
jgi:hypothetical protein